MSDRTVGRIEQLKHTPGPWRWMSDIALVGDHGRRPVVLTGGSDNGSLLTRGEDGLLRELTADEPDARLIAAAPELLAACKAVLAQFEAGALVRNTDSDGGEDWAIKAIEPLNALSLMAGAIAKAEGRS